MLKIKAAINEEIKNRTPAWIDKGLTVEDIEGIQHHGCASGAYMPATIHSESIVIMNEWGGAILQYIEHEIGEVPPHYPLESWGSMACFYVSLAVELWAAQFDIDSALIW